MPYTTDIVFSESGDSDIKNNWCSLSAQDLRIAEYCIAHCARSGEVPIFLPESEPSRDLLRKVSLNFGLGADILERFKRD